MIQEGDADALAPTNDAYGNQTLVKTSTGIWSVTNNAANRPVVFANEATGTVVECSYDSSGRRATKKVTVNGTVTLHQRYIYRGYLQIACCDLTRTAHPCLWLITWDPTQPIATRPLAIQKDGTWYTYGFDLTKNVTEVFTTTGYIGTAYTYTPYGEVSASGNVTQPIQWSSEYHDTELGLVYYNYRHYNPEDGRWLRRDPMGEVADPDLYCFCRNSMIFTMDRLGLNVVIISGGIDPDPYSENPREAHDLNWKNFVGAAEIYISRYTKPSEECPVEWWVHRTSYATREKNDSDVNWAQSVIDYFRDIERGNYVDWIKKRAEELKVKLRWFDNANEFRRLLASAQNGLPRSGSSLITKMVYYGHGLPGSLWIAYKGDKIEAENFKASYFAHNPTIHLVTCHSASRYIVKRDPLTSDISISIAEKIRNIIGSGVVFGYDGRVDYAPVAKGLLPQPGRTFNYYTAVSDPSRVPPKKSKDDDAYNVARVKFE